MLRTTVKPYWSDALEHRSVGAPLWLTMSGVDSIRYLPLHLRKSDTARVQNWRA